MHLSSNLCLRVGKGFTGLIFVLLFGLEVDALISGRNYSVPQREGSSIGIVEQWFLLGVCQDTKSRREYSF